MEEGKLKFSASIYFIWITVASIFYIYVLYQSSDNVALQLGSFFFIAFTAPVFWFVVQSSMVGLTKLRPAKVVSLCDGMTCRLLNKKQIGAGKLRCEFVADKGVVPNELNADFKKWFGFVTKIVFQTKFIIDVLEKDLVSMPPDAHTTPEGIYYYYGEGGLSKMGKIDIDAKRELQLKYYENLASNYSDFQEKISSYAEILSKQNNNDLQETAQKLNNMIMQTTNSTTGTLQNAILQMASIENNKGK